MVSQKTVFAADVGGSKLLCGLVTETGEILDLEKTPLSPDMTAEGLETHLLASYNALLARNPEYCPTACGMTIPGVADPESGMWIYACFSGISDYPVRERVSKLLELPVTIENDANANAWGEKVFGNCRERKNFLWVTVSNGVGGGLILDGRLYRGHRLGAGEIGHMVVEQDHPLLCPCGHLGCLEAMASGRGISARFQALTGEYRSAAEIAELAREGDEFAISVMEETGHYIGRALGKTASLLNLEAYVLGGGVMQSFDLLEGSIRKAFAAEAFAQPNQSIPILQTALGYEAGLLSAAALALDPPK